MSACNGTNIVYITLFCAILSVTWAAEISLLVPVEITLLLRQHANTCGKEFGVDPAYLKKVIDGSLPDDEASKRFLFCIFSDTGFIEKDGRIIVENMKQFNIVKGTTDDFMKVATECNNKATYKVNYETTYEQMHCIVSAVEATVAT